MPKKRKNQKFIFTKTENKKITAEEAKAMLQKNLEENFKGTIKEQVFFETENSVKLQAVLVEKKNIAVGEKLIFGIGNE